MKGIDEASCWKMLTPFWKKRFIQTTKDHSYFKYDLIRNYRDHPGEAEYEKKVMWEMMEFEKEKEAKGIKAHTKILNSKSKPIDYKFFIDPQKIARTKRTYLPKKSLK